MGFEWKVQDVRQMEGISSESVGVAVDKGTLDAHFFGEFVGPV
jgi:hypothetical protein